jgi:hypothetical protein
MFKVELKAVASTLNTDELQQYFLSDGTSNFFSPMTYTLQESDVNLKFALAKCVSDKLDIDSSQLHSSFCGLNKIENCIEIIFYIKLSTDFNPPEKYYLIPKSIARESEYVRKVEVFI